MLHELLDALPSGREHSTATRRLKQEISELIIDSITEIGVIQEEELALPPVSNQAAHVYWFNRSCEKLPQAIDKRLRLRVCVDEFQNLKTPADSLCESLHLASLGLKIVPVYFGLGNAPDVLGNAKVSRMLHDNNIPLAAISTNAGTSLLDEFLDTLNVECEVGVDREQLVAETAKRCSCWPHHLTSWMQAACDTLPNYDFKMTSESRNEIDRLCDEYRRDYYAARLSGCRYLRGQARREKFGSLLREKHSITETEIEDVLSPTFESSTATFDIEDFLDDAIRRGFLAERIDGSFGVPIPSLVNFLLDPATI